MDDFTRTPKTIADRFISATRILKHIRATSTTECFREKIETVPSWKTDLMVISYNTLF
jgi:hypothetical protein